MSFLHNLEDSSGLGTGLLWLSVVFCAAAALVSMALPTDRTRIRTALTLFILGIVTLIVATMMPEQNIYYQWTCHIGSLSISLAVVTIAGVFLFDVVLFPIGAKPPEILCDLILAFAYVGSALLLLSHVGVQASAIVATSTVITAAIGFSLQDTLSNVIGGVTIQLERTISVGDWIRVNDLVGEVKAVRWRQTSIETRNWDTVVIPNGTIMKSNVIVLGRRAGTARQHRQEVTFNVDFRFAPTKVMAAVTEALATGPLNGIAVEPAPMCLLMEFRDSFASYSVFYWLSDLPRDYAADSLIRSRIFFALRRNGMTPAIPAYRNFQTDEGSNRRERINAENTARRVEAITQIDLLSPLTEEERGMLGQRLHDCPYAAGETIAKQGDESACLFIILSGQAEVRLALDATSPSRSLALLGPGQFFGEMGLMTGDRRAATVTAVTDVNCLRLDKEDFHDVLLKRPEIAESISQILVARRGALETTRDHLHGEAIELRSRAAQVDLLQKIKRFFHLK